MLRYTVTSLALACATVLLVVPHAWPVTTDAARAAVTVVQTALVWPVALYHSAWPVRLLALVFAALGCVQQAFVLGINTGEFYPHLIPGLLLMRGGVLALGSSGLPFPIAASQGVCTLAVLLLLAVGQWYQTLLGRGLHVAHVAHELMFIVVGCLVLTGTLQSVLPAPRAARLQEARRLLDPICYAALGVLFLSHIHDKSAVGTAWHVVLGWALVGQAAALLLASFVHAHNPPQGVASLANACVAYAWVMPGVWLIHMASFHYLFARGWHNDVDIKQGVHHLLWPGELVKKITFGGSLTVDYLSQPTTLIGHGRRDGEGRRQGARVHWCLPHRRPALLGRACARSHPRRQQRRPGRPDTLQGA